MRIAGIRSIWLLPPVTEVHEKNERVVAARGGKGVQSLVGDDLLPPCALHVDDGRFTGDSDRLLDLAHAHVGVERCDTGTRNLDGVALDCGEPGQCEGQAVGAWQKFREAIHARVIAHR